MMHGCLEEGTTVRYIVNGVGVDVGGIKPHPVLLGKCSPGLFRRKASCSSPLWRSQWQIPISKHGFLYGLCSPFL